MSTVQEGKAAAIISYITIVGAVIAIFMNNEKKNTFAAFHIRQALGLSLLFFILGYFIGSFDNWYVTVGFWLLLFLLKVYGLMGAMTSKELLIPVLGEYFQKTFKNLNT